MDVVDGRRARRARRSPWPLVAVLGVLLLLLGWGVARMRGSATPSPFTEVAADDFTGSRLDLKHWSVYDGSAGGQRWDPANCVVAGGVLTLRAESDGSTCGIAWRENQTYGAYEVRAKFDAPAAPQFDTTFIAWPADDSQWRHAEIDYVEEKDPARQSITGFVHCTQCPDGQLEAGPMALDMTTWHTYRVEWTPASLRFLIDGRQWFEVTDRAVISNLPHHPTLQTDYEADGRTPTVTTTEVDWIKIYDYHGNAR